MCSPGKTKSLWFLLGKGCKTLVGSSCSLRELNPSTACPASIHQGRPSHVSCIRQNEFPKVHCFGYRVSTYIQWTCSIASDLPSSGTLWDGRLDEDSWGKGHGASDLMEDNIEHVGCSLLRDKTSVLSAHWPQPLEISKSILSYLAAITRSLSVSTMEFQMW